MRVLFIAAAAAVLIDRRSARAIASDPRFERRSGMSRHCAAGVRSVREGRTGSCFLAMCAKRTGHAAKTRQRMVDVLADRKKQLHRRRNGGHGQLYRSHQLPRNGERRAPAQSKQVKKPATCRRAPSAKKNSPWASKERVPPASFGP